MLPTLNKQQTLAALPPEWPEEPLPGINLMLKANPRKVVVLDDDPTGTQTVYDVPVLTTWSIDALKTELQNQGSTFYILTNSRSLPLPQAQALNAEIGRNLATAARQTDRAFTVVSRSDSTLRGHFPGEVASLVEVLGQPIDGWLIIPFFLEGGRYTLNDIHYVAEGEQLIPAAQTPFARDAAFGYHTSNLRDWVQEKTKGAVPAESVASISIDDLRQGGPQVVAQKLFGLTHSSVCVVNAASMRDMQVFVQGLLTAEAQGKAFVYRTAASFVQARAGLEPKPVLTAADLSLPQSGGGLIVVGSYVPKTTHQLGELLKLPNMVKLELDVENLLNDAQCATTIKAATEAVNQTLSQNRDVLLYTSRKLIIGQDAASSLVIGQRVSEALVTIVRQTTSRPRYVLAKGGITSSDIATQGFGVKRALVQGQILPGVPLWSLGQESRWPGLVYIVFPGNVGGPQALVEVVSKLGRD